MNATIKKVIDFAVGIAEDETQGYDQLKRFGPDWDCSSLVNTAWENADVPVKSLGATYTGNMKPAYLKAGFINVIHLINLLTGDGLIPGDVLLRTTGHTALYIGKNSLGLHIIVQAAGNEKGTDIGGQPGDQTGREIYIRQYYNSPPSWDIVFRYVKEENNMNPYPVPTRTYPAGIPFSGPDALWFIFNLRARGHDLSATSDKAAAKTWEAIYKEQEKAGLKRGDAGPQTRAIFLLAPETDYKFLYETEKTRGDRLQAKIDAAKIALG